MPAGFESSGLALWIGGNLQSFDTQSLFALLLLVIASIKLLTGFANNLATAVMSWPVLISVAESAQLEPFVLLIGATVSTFCAFMLPVATAPNFVVFGS